MLEVGLLDALYESEVVCVLASFEIPLDVSAFEPEAFAFDLLVVGMVGNGHGCGGCGLRLEGECGLRLERNYGGRFLLSVEESDSSCFGREQVCGLLGCVLGGEEGGHVVVHSGV